MNRRLLVLTMLLAACGGGFHTPGQEIAIGLSARAEPRSDNNMVLTVSRMRLVLGSIQLSQAGGVTEQLDGPFLVEPKLDGSITEIVKQAIDHGSYGNMSLSLRPLSANDPAEASLAHANGFDDLLQANATLAFEGTFGPEGTPGATYQLLWTTTGEHTVRIDDGLQVKVGAPSNVTLSTDLKEWFARDALGHPIDPRNSDADDAFQAFSGSLRASGEDDDHH